MRLLILPFAAITALVSCGGEPDVHDRVRIPGERLQAFCSARVVGKGTVNVEIDYLPNVVHCENGGAPTESLKAQAVAARTYLYYKLATAGVVQDGQSDQVYSCPGSPTPAQSQAVVDTAGQFLSYQGSVVCAFFVAGSKQSPPACQGAALAPTEKYVTYNQSLVGDQVHQSPLGFVSPTNKRNRGCMSQWGSRCLADIGWSYPDILKFYYGSDITLETAQGPCIHTQALPPQGYLDQVSCDRIQGWAYDNADPTATVPVRISFDAVGSNDVATIPVRANRRRADLCAALGSCGHAFDLPMPVGMRDGSKHAVYAEVRNLDGEQWTTLPGSPRMIQCGPPAPPVMPDEGVLRRIADPRVLTAWKLSPVFDVVKYSDAEVHQYAAGPDLPSIPELVRDEEGDPQIWMKDSGTIRLVQVPEAVGAWRLDAATIQVAPHAQLHRVPTAAPWPRAPFVVKGTSAEVFLIDTPLTHVEGSGQPSSPRDPR